MLKIEIHLVNGGLLDLEESDSFWHRLVDLQKCGFAGKELIHELISDDWGPPPRLVCIQGSLIDGTKIDVTLPYD